MFQAVIHRAQVAVDRTIDQAINRTVSIIPFLVAAGYITASLTTYFTQEFGSVVGNLFMAAIFFAIGLIIAGLMYARKAPPESLDAVEAEASSAESPATATASPGAPGPIDSEILATALKSAAPLALPELLRLMVRNLPLLAILSAFLFLISRPSTTAAGEAHNDAPVPTAAN